MADCTLCTKFQQPDCLHQLLKAKRFRLNWLEYNHPRYASILTSNVSKSTPGSSSAEFQPTRSELRHAALQSPQVIIDATRLKIRLPRSAFRCYFSIWVSQFNKKLPVLPEDASLRDSLVIHAWRQLIPCFLQNQLLPPSDDPREMREIFRGARQEGGRQFIGPDFRELWKWLRSVVDADEEFMDAYLQDQEAETENILPEGLLQASRYYAWLTSEFQPGWIQAMLKMAFGTVSARWKSWICSTGNQDEFEFDKPGSSNFQTQLGAHIDPLAYTSAHDP